MTAVVIILAILLIAAVAAAVSLAMKLAERKAECGVLAERLHALESDNARLAAELEAEKKRAADELEAERKRTAEELNAERKRAAAELDAERKRAAEEKNETDKRFELLARRIIDEQSTAMRQNHNREIDALLSPLKEDLTRFKTRVEEVYAAEARERFSLGEKIKDLVEANRSIGKRAEELSTALRGNSKVQGDWGELVLESILAKSGLREGEEFVTQATRDENGRLLHSADGRALRPDVVVRYPDLGFIVIDSKVSLSAFTDYVNADTEDARAEALRRHVTSVTRHIKELGDKDYQNLAGTDGKLDFVVMFIPNEGAYAAALQAEPTLWQKAYDKRVLLAGPTQLVGALRLVEQMWRHDRQTRNAIEIATRGGQLYDKFAAFVEDLLKVQRNLQTTGRTLDEAMKKLSTGKGNIVSRTLKLKELGAKTSKDMPPELKPEPDGEHEALEAGDQS